MDITLLEFHLDDASFTANAPFSGTGGEEAADGSEHGDATSVSEGTSVPEGADARPFAFLAVLVGLALLAKYLRSRKSSEEPVEEAVEADPTPDAG